MNSWREVWERLRNSGIGASFGAGTAGILFLAYARLRADVTFNEAVVLGGFFGAAVSGAIRSFVTPAARRLGLYFDILELFILGEIGVIESEKIAAMVEERTIRHYLGDPASPRSLEPGTATLNARGVLSASNKKALVHSQRSKPSSEF